jgi:hypothetical protein
LTIQSEATSSATNIDNCYVIQTYNGIEIFRAVSNFAIKDKRVINTQNKFIANVSWKINTAYPLISATEALFKAYLQLITIQILILRQKKLVSINTKLQITFVIMGQLRLIWYSPSGK